MTQMTVLRGQLDAVRSYRIGGMLSDRLFRTLNPLTDSPHRPLLQPRVLRHLVEYLKSETKVEILGALAISPRLNPELRALAFCALGDLRDGRQWVPDNIRTTVQERARSTLEELIGAGRLDQHVQRAIVTLSRSTDPASLSARNFDSSIPDLRRAPE